MSALPAPPSVKGWCPGALRPMASGDGLLVRVRVTGGVVDAATFAALGRLSAQHGNGLVDLSQRANLQIRGVRAETLDALVADLDALGLLDPSPAAEAVRNVIGPPLAGIDQAAGIDGAALVRALEARLVGDPELHALPDKFGLLVDDGGRLRLDDVAADVRLVADRAGVMIAIGGDAASAAPVARVAESEAAEAAVTLAKAFLALRAGTDARRFRTLVATIGIEPIRAAAGCGRDASPPSALRRQFSPTRPADILGLQTAFAGAAAPFGRLTAEQVAVIAGAASGGPGAIRLTPWRAVLLPGADADAVAMLEAAGLIVDPVDPRLAVAACPGRPACPSGVVDTRGAAEALAPLLRGRDRVVLHVSGCAKGCARPAATAITLTGRDGRFDLIIDGRADAPPVRSGLDLAAARAAVEGLVSRSTEPAPEGRRP